MSTFGEKFAFQNLVRASFYDKMLVPEELYLSGYKMLRLLGKGAMGMVFECEKISSGQRFAAKILNPAYTKNAQVNSQFETEAKIIARLKHPNIIGVYDLIHSEDIYFLLMDLCRGPKLSAVIKSPDFPVSGIVHIMTCLFDAVKYSHSKHIIHHDIKPGNIMFHETSDPQNPCDRPVLCDFGLANIKSSVQPSDNIRKIAGTPHYMSPEKIMGEMTQQNEHQSDLFSMGVVFYLMLTGGVFPFPGDDKKTIFNSIMHAAPAEPVKINHRISVSLNAVVMKLLEKNPGHRYFSAEDVLDDLNNLKRGRPVSVYKKLFHYRIFLYLQTHPVRTGITVLMLFVMLFYAYYFIVSGMESEFKFEKAPFFSEKFSYSDIENKWILTNPFTGEAYSHSDSLRNIAVDDGMLSIDSSEFPVSVVYAGSPAVPDYSFEVKIVRLPDTGGFGLYYGGNMTETGIRNKGIYFYLRDGKFSVYYPDLSTLLAKGAAVPEWSGLKTVKFIKEFPVLKFFADNEILFETDMSFLPGEASFNNPGIVADGGVLAVRNPEFRIRQYPLMQSQFVFAERLMAEGDYKNALNELSACAESAEPCADLLNYYKGFIFFRLKERATAAKYLKSSIPADYKFRTELICAYIDMIDGISQINNTINKFRGNEYKLLLLVFDDIENTDVMDNYKLFFWRDFLIQFKESTEEYNDFLRQLVLKLTAESVKKNNDFAYDYICSLKNLPGYDNYEISKYLFDLAVSYIEQNPEKAAVILEDLYCRTLNDTELNYEVICTLSTAYTASGNDLKRDFWFKKAMEHIEQS